LSDIITITKVGHEGDGLAETAGGPLYVPYSLPGETLRLERQGERGLIEEIVTASPERVAPPCRHFGACGGCALQHWTMDAYLAWKRDQVVNALAQRGIEAAVAPIIPVAPNSRRRVTFTVANTTGGIVLGFNRRGSNEILPIEECHVVLPAIAEALPMFRRISRFLLQRGSARLSVTLADNGFDINAEIEGRPRPSPQLIGAASAERAIARLSLNGEEVYRPLLPEIAIPPGTLFPPPGGFLQASAAAEEALAGAVLAAVGTRGPFADLFAGAGTFTLRLAQRDKVAAFEGETPAVAALELAVRKARGIKPVTARRRDLFRNPVSAPELKGFGAVVLDPPRAGARAQCEALAQSVVPRIAYVSCNPATVARDARILIDAGYRLTAVTPVDQFVWSPHVELVGAFEKTKR
jgi:23S rRNA (uracil1939-C5)-methyltransferase